MCTESKNHQKVVTRHVWQNHLEEVEHLRQHQHVKQIYAKRKETVERVFADAKEKHGMRWTTLRGLKKLSMQAMLTFCHESEEDREMVVEQTNPGVNQVETRLIYS